MLFLSIGYREQQVVLVHFPFTTVWYSGAMAVPTTPTTPCALAPSPEEVPISKLLVGAAQEIGRDKPEDDRLVLSFTG